MLFNYYMAATCGSMSKFYKLTDYERSEKMDAKTIDKARR